MINHNIFNSTEMFIPKWNEQKLVTVPQFGVFEIWGGSAGERKRTVFKNQEWFTNTGTMFLTQIISPFFLYKISFALCSRKKTLCSIYFSPPKIFPVAPSSTLNSSFLHNLGELSFVFIYIFALQISFYVKYYSF